MDNFNEEGLKIKELLNSSFSPNINQLSSHPTILSLQDTISCVEKKYGKEWRSKSEAQCIVIWASKMFLEEHIKEIVPDLYDLCIEYKIKGTINGHKIPEDFYLLAFSIF